MMPINSAEDRLLAQIDGRRTLGEIVDRCEPSHSATRVLQFFERLWQYDQIVFDVSCAEPPLPALE
jgi:hypothetical protein